MPVMEFTRGLMALCHILLFITAIPTSAGPAAAQRIHMEPAEHKIFAPRGVNYMVELQCEVAEGNKPLWKINGHTYYSGNGNIFINTTENRKNSSVLRIGDAGFDTFHGNEITISCTAFGYSESVGRLIVRYGAPSKPGDIKLLGNTISWGRPENDVLLEYIVVVVNTTDGSPSINETVTEERIKVNNFPECFNVTVWARNRAGISKPTFHSHTPPSCGKSEDISDPIVSAVPTTPSSSHPLAYSALMILAGLVVVLTGINHQ